MSQRHGEQGASLVSARGMNGDVRYDGVVVCGALLGRVLTSHSTRSAAPNPLGRCPEPPARLELSCSCASPEFEGDIGDGAVRLPAAIQFGSPRRLGMRVRGIGQSWLTFALPVNHEFIFQSISTFHRRRAGPVHSSSVGTSRTARRRLWCPPLNC